MMRFPPRLTWDLARVRIAQKLFGVTRSPLAFPLDLADFPAQSELPLDASVDSSSPASSRDSQALARLCESTAPVVWIGGATPLRHPRIGQIAQDITNLGRTVFIETDGTLLRRRIHEFKPVSRLYLVLPLNGLETAHDQRAQQPGNFRATIESIRTVKLSGFHICAETTIFAATDTEALRTLANFIPTLDIDGWIQKRPPLSAIDQPSQEKLAAARKLIPSPGWQMFSAYLTLPLPLGAPHAEFASLPSAAGGEVGGIENGSPSQESPVQEESAHAL